METELIPSNITDFRNNLPETSIESCEEYFVREGHNSLLNPQMIAVNSTAEIFYTVKIEMRLELDMETHEIRIEVGDRTISQHHVMSGENKVYDIDDNLTAIQLRLANDFYVLDDYLVVLITYNADTYQFVQHVLHLDEKRQIAYLGLSRTITFSGMSNGINCSFGELGLGRLLITGYCGPLDGNREVMGFVIAANPMSSINIPDHNVSKQIQSFSHYLGNIDAGLSIFASGIFLADNSLLFLIKQGDQRSEGDELLPGLLGKRALVEKAENQLLPVKPGRKLCTGWICPRYVRQIAHRGRHIWMALVVPDYETAASSIKWRIYLRFVYYIIRGITWGLQATVRIHQYDGGICLRLYLSMLKTLFGQQMLPTMAPPPKFFLYNLDAKTLEYRKVQYQPPRIEVATTGSTAYLMAMDCSNDGGLLVVDLPHKNDIALSARYYHSPDQPAKLTRIAQHTAYRFYPSYERSDMMRRSMGILNWSWKL